MAARGYFLKHDPVMSVLGHLELEWWFGNAKKDIFTQVTETQLEPAKQKNKEFVVESSGSDVALDKPLINSGLHVILPAAKDFSLSLSLSLSLSYSLSLPSSPLHSPSLLMCLSHSLPPTSNLLLFWFHSRQHQPHESKMVTSRSQFLLRVLELQVWMTTPSQT
jgi:hypothetical protein